MKKYRNEKELKDYLEETIMNDDTRWHNVKDLSTKYSFMIGNYQIDESITFERFVEMVNEILNEGE